jgi:hypothetical protein
MNTVENFKSILISKLLQSNASRDKGVSFNPYEFDGDQRIEILLDNEPVAEVSEVLIHEAAALSPGNNSAMELMARVIIQQLEYTLQV